ncbi:alpha-1,2-fucosyltransferase [Tellurirhabdus rosea]|uniref:alpha-1,2-fucosyltransferase n=1 Tax=Tellurirhabdus rosea TaxID=2674997 RepID=UPI00224E1E5F|nr:alpha-1,2-fucosyltransferase [Tellurirhabdus rosea]
MIVTELNGGLGNQLFQYALGRYLAERHRTELWLDNGFLLQQSSGPDSSARRTFALDGFTIDPKMAPSAVTRRYGLRPTRAGRVWGRVRNTFFNRGPLTYLAERTPFRADSRVLQAPDNSYLSGYWQSRAYVDPIAAVLRQELVFREALPPVAGELAEQIRGAEAVCLHVRRGDFVNNARHQVTEPAYFYRAEEVLKQRLERPTLFVFSDDMDWCRTNLRFRLPAVYAAEEHSLPGGPIHFQLMTLCRHFVIPNSTFSWWAAFLGRKADSLVVAPRLWLREKGRSVTAPELKYPHWIEL